MEILIDGRDQVLYQWDKGQRLILVGFDPAVRVDFSPCGSKKAVPIHAYLWGDALYCDIHDRLLMTSGSITVYVRNSTETLYVGILTVVPAAKPADYVEPEEIRTWSELKERIQKLEDEGVPDEKIERAVEDYLEENPIEAPKPDLTGVVKSVNGKTPDENGNVEITVSGSSQSGTGTVEIVGVVSRPPGSDPTVTETEDSTPEARKYILGIPGGTKGVGIKNTVVLNSPDGYTEVTISYTDGEEYTLTIPHGKDYNLTPADKAEIAEMAAELVEVPEQDSSQNGSFRTDETLNLEDGVLSVNTTDLVEQDNTLPITSAGVYATVGNIEALLKTI